MAMAGVSRFQDLVAWRLAVEFKDFVDFARFAYIAKASELEVLNHLTDAHSKGHLTAAELDRGVHAVKKALKAINGLIRHLESTPHYGRK